MKREIGQGATVLVAAVIIAAIVGGVAVYFLMPAPTEKEKPKVVRVLCTASTLTDALAKYAVEDFEKETGYTASIEIIARSIWWDRVMKELIEDSGFYDVVMIGGGDQAYLTKEKGHFIPLETYLTEEEMNNIYGREWWTTEDGKLIGMPQYYNFPMLFYRKDLMEDPAEKAAFKAEYGYELKPPTNYDELYDVAEFFNRPPDMYGFFAGGVNWSICLDHTYFLYGMGANYGDEETGELTLNTTEAKRAMEALTRMAQFNPPGWETLNFHDGAQYMLDGKIFMYQSWFAVWATFCDQIPDEIGVAVPTGDVQPGVHLGSFVAVIPKATPNPDAGAAFIKWMMSYDYQKKQAIETGNFPIRIDTMEDPEVKASIRDYDIFMSAMSYLTFQHCTWPGELGSGIYEAISRVLDGSMTPTEACDWLQNVKFAGRKAME